MAVRGSGPCIAFSPTEEQMARALETGLPHEAEILVAVVSKRPGNRLYSRLIERCGQCHCLVAGTQFKASTCSQTGQEVLEFAPPPMSCPLPLHA